MLRLVIVAEDVADLVWPLVLSVTGELLPLDRLFASLCVNSVSSSGTNALASSLIGLSNSEK